MAKKHFDKTDGMTTFKVEPKTEGQKIYFEALFDPKIKYLAATGPAGCGKSYLSTYSALEGLRKEEFNKIYISRSVTGIKGEALGFLPGNSDEKMEEWLLPILDHGEKMVQGLDQIINSGRIEFLPLAYIRGRSIDRSIVLVTEAQNLSFEVLKCLLTRIDFRSKLILEGDWTQNDRTSANGQTDFEKVCRAMDGMHSFELVEMDKRDIIRSKDIAEILDRLEKFE